MNMVLLTQRPYRFPKINFVEGMFRNREDKLEENIYLPNISDNQCELKFLPMPLL